MAGLTKRQREALMRNSPSPSDILDNPEYIKELNEEIATNYDQRQASLEAENDPTLSGVQDFSFDNTNHEEPPVAEDTYEIPRDTDEDLQKELAKVNRQLEKERKQREVEAAKEAPEQPRELTQEESIEQQVLHMLRNTKGAPNEAGIAKLKQQYGEKGVYVVALGEGDVYVFTHLRRGQWKMIQEYVGKASQTEAFGGKADDMLKEKVLTRCVLFPKVDDERFLHNSRAGVIDTLFELIMLNSYFLTPQQSLALTVTL